jgi:hypothetical protein
VVSAIDIAELLSGGRIRFLAGNPPVRWYGATGAERDTPPAEGACDDLGNQAGNTCRPRRPAVRETPAAGASGSKPLTPFR